VTPRIYTHTTHIWTPRHPPIQYTDPLRSSTIEHRFQCPSSSMTTIQRKRKHERFQPPRAPNYFFIGRQDHPPYAWAYDDDEMRASNIMWIIEDIIDDKNLDRVYFEEIASAKARGARMSRGEVMGGRKRRKGLAGGIIDLSISNSGGDEDYTGSVLDVRPQLKSSLSNPERSVDLPTIFSTNSSISTARPRSRQHMPTKRPFMITAVDGKTVLELRGVFVGCINGSLSSANV
jgi:hypothetical protein